ncbi:unnamed protein product [Cuscuta europaea]|uniref:Uncharacterized protein n=1 Tax=Cuscuta europaea TaxID=41803 RepID=A0A9P1E9X3_CUSEU|nr:unnamed protein product [Cuscuta europaea]
MPRTPLTHPVSTILNYAEEQDLFPKDPRSAREIYAIHQGDTYCRYHKSTSHNTDDCVSLKKAIELLIQRGELHQFIKNAPRKNTGENTDKEEGDIATKKHEIGRLSDGEEFEEPQPKKRHLR